MQEFTRWRRGGLGNEDTRPRTRALTHRRIALDLCDGADVALQAGHLTSESASLRCHIDISSCARSEKFSGGGTGAIRAGSGRGITARGWGCSGTVTQSCEQALKPKASVRLSSDARVSELDVFSMGLLHLLSFIGLFLSDGLDRGVDRHALCLLNLCPAHRGAGGALERSERVDPAQQGCEQRRGSTPLEQQRGHASPIEGAPIEAVTGSGSFGTNKVYGQR